jgi:hypothetical protein
MKRPLGKLALALSLAVTSCDPDGITSPNVDLALEASISDASIRPGETATITYRVRNVGPVARTIDVHCTLLPYIKDESDVTVYPAGGAWICLAVVRPPVTLAPGAEIIRTIVVNGGPTVPQGGPAVRLPPGRYTLYVEFDGAADDLGQRVQLRSRDVPFEVVG